MLLSLPFLEIIMSEILPEHSCLSPMQQHLTQQLESALNPTHLEVINESHQHSGSASESHFKLVVVSDYFSDLKLLDRHRFINKLFIEELEHIHALAMHTYTPDEWSIKNGAPDSPKCAGGSKS
jgi:transcriptional regulator, BolA protein family